MLLVKVMLLENTRANTSGLTTAPADPAMQEAHEGLAALVPTPFSPPWNKCGYWLAVNFQLQLY